LERERKTASTKEVAEGSEPGQEGTRAEATENFTVEREKKEKKGHSSASVRSGAPLPSLATGKKGGNCAKGGLD